MFVMDLRGKFLFETETQNYSLTWALIHNVFQINHDYDFHPALQRWVIGKRLAQDRETLYHYGVRDHDDSAFLFILSAQTANLSREQERKEKDDRRIDGTWSIFMIKIKTACILNRSLLKRVSFLMKI